MQFLIQDDGARVMSELIRIFVENLDRGDVVSLAVGLGAVGLGLFAQPRFNSAGLGGAQMGW
ncbi:MAG: hypothetical protein DMG08_16375 [Acidobacteria bacterium]|nr:MAG: hypothetical protein DMG08_16375 [Acidobacteriota bacterium]